MRVCLVQPPNLQLSDPTTRWPLSLGYIEAVLVKAGYDVTVADLRNKTEVLPYLPEADIFAITATTGEIKTAKEIARLVKERRPRTFTLIGGPHATYLPTDCMHSFDCVFVGDAELDITSVLSELTKGVRFGKPAKELDDLPFPTRHEFGFSTALFEGAGYGKGPKATSLITSRGCPFSCAFCQVIPKEVRYRSAKNVVEEITSIVTDWDCRHFRFEDDNFTLKPERLFEMCRLLEPMKIHFRCHTRSQLFTRDVARALRSAGCDEVGFGIESADPFVLEVINKGETLEDDIRAIRLCEDAGMKSKAFFMTGLPGETDDIAELTKRFLEKAQPSKVILSRFTPYPGSAVWDQREKYNVLWVDPDFNHFWNFPDSTTITYAGSDKEALERRYRDLHNLLWNGSWTSLEATRQREQLARYLEWIDREGGKELPTRIDTMVAADQIARMNWLKERVTGTIMEVGTNFGIVLAWCGGQCGVDINPANVKLAQILAPKRNFVVGDARKLPFPDNSFDTVMMPDVIEHLYFSEVEVAVKEALRVARKKVLVTVPDAEADASKAKSFKHAWLATNDKLREITAGLEKNGFTFTRQHGFIFLEVIKC